eukprot:GHRR01030957.1.p1 GENE.GHRR01030957.1~~GHRR01030957.1.p1  ORF type:complete len:142 (+),score=46.59 GHRR01030957.1:814-1239(+)
MSLPSCTPCIQALCRDARCVPAGGASELEMARQVAEFGKKQTGLDQYAIARYAEALEIVPRTIAENSGLPASEVIARLYAAHSAGQVGWKADMTNSYLLGARACCIQLTTMQHGLVVAASGELLQMQRLPGRVQQTAKQVV